MDLTKIKVKNDTINNFSKMTRGEINLSVALYAYINDNLAKAKKTNKDKVSFEVTNFELKKVAKYNGRGKATDRLITLEDSLKGITLTTTNNNNIKVELDPSSFVMLEDEYKLYNDKDFTIINLEILLQLSTKLEKILYILMLQHRKSTTIQMNFNTLQAKVGTSVPNGVVKQRLNKAIDSLNNTFNGLCNEITWKYENKTGHQKIKGFILTYNKKALKSNNVEKRNLGTTKTSTVKSNNVDNAEIAKLKAQIKKLEQELKAKDEEINNLKQEQETEEQKQEQNNKAGIIVSTTPTYCTKSNDYDIEDFYRENNNNMNYMDNLKQKAQDVSEQRNLNNTELDNWLANVLD
ncbi:hypothetical protein [Ligilactobacillus cholophilus]|uniref:hypothetical protein n=1 Tax=Ligilactobacillus cholophilus TaxID=3050131 RepID=UPI0025B063DC|nr:hypothetical protein [Ligilactobacillus cholophilus]